MKVPRGRMGLPAMCGARRMSLRTPGVGFTILELLIVCVILVTVSAIAVTRLQSSLAAAQLRHARGAFGHVLNATRAAGVRAGQSACLQLTDGRRLVGTLDPGGARIPASDSLDLWKSYRVTVRPENARIDYDARALARGDAAQRFVLTNARGDSDTLCVSPLGVLSRGGCVQ